MDLFIQTLKNIQRIVEGNKMRNLKTKLTISLDQCQGSSMSVWIMAIVPTDY